MNLSQLEIGDMFTIINENMGISPKEGIVFILKQKDFTFYDGGMIHYLCDEIGSNNVEPFYLDPEGGVRKYKI